MQNGNCIIKNAHQVVTCSGFSPKTGTQMSDLHIIEDGAVVIEKGLIRAVGKSGEILREQREKRYRIIGTLKPLGAERITLWFYFPSGFLPAFYECPGTTARLIDKGNGVWGLEFDFNSRKGCRKKSTVDFTLGYAPAIPMKSEIDGCVPDRCVVKKLTPHSAVLSWKKRSKNEHIRCKSSSRYYQNNSRS